MFKIDPYQAYLAPTDWILHDGSSDGFSDLDLSILGIGGFYICTPQHIKGYDQATR